MKECSKWVDSVDEWISNVEELYIVRALQLPKKATKVTFRKVLLTRNFAHFLSKLAKDKTTTYCTWIQIIDAIQRLVEGETEISLLSIFETLSEFETHRVNQKSVGSTAFHVHFENLSFSIVPKSSRD